MNLRDYADLILKPYSIRVDKTDELLNKLDQKTDNIFKDRAEGRTLPQVKRDVKSMVVEYAMLELDERFILNPKKHNYKDIHSYAYDVIDKSNQKTFEVKIYYHGDGRDAAWWSYRQQLFDKIFKRAHVIDYVVAGTLIDHPSHFEVGFKLLANAKTLYRYVKQSKQAGTWTKEGVYISPNPYYSHKVAQIHGECFFNENVRYQNDNQGISSSPTRVYRSSEQEVSRLSESQF